jgi:LDH2 family malate/lactate/ureidoglycolate dehydrogenase
MDVSYQRFEYAKIFELCKKIFCGYGFTEEESTTITEILTKADLYGIESHGIQRMIRYHKAITQEGMVKVDAVPEIVFETPISAVIDAKDAMGQLVSKEAMNLAIKKAKEVGFGAVTVRSSNHYGIAGYYTRMAAEQDLIGICMTNSEAIMVPTFARKAMIGSNPIALSMPADPTPFLFDAATTVVPRGKLEVYNKREKPLPYGWGLVASGEVSTNAQDVLDAIIAKQGGGILPLGGAGEENAGYKGYGFGLICELFTSIFSGGPTSNHSYVVKGKADTAHCFMALDYRIFGDKEEIRKNFSTFLQELRDTPKAQGHERVYIHGEKELESEIEKRENGIPMNSKTFAELQMIAESLNIDSTPYLRKEF